MEEKVTISVNVKKSVKTFRGSNLSKALDAFWWFVCENDLAGSIKLFTVEGMGRFTFNSCAFHHCLDNGSISEQEMLELCRVA